MKGNMVYKVAVFFLGFILLGPKIASSELDSVTPASKLNLVLYYESLCPDCQDFIEEQLYPTYKKVSDIFNLALVPYGNADESKEGGQWKFSCQHGKEECIGNIIETCAISLLKNITVSFPFVHCFERNIDDQDPHSVAKQCATKLGIDYSPIDACQKGPLGNQLEHEMALKTEALEPRHTYVPWITLNGKHTEKMQDQAQDNLLKLLCEYYAGPTPPECRSLYSARRCYKHPIRV